MAVSSEQSSNQNAPKQSDYIRWFEDITNQDVEQVGGKNASLGEMIGELSETGIQIPGGFATTASAFRLFLEHNDLTETIRGQLQKVDEQNGSIQDAGKTIRERIRDGVFPEDVQHAIRNAYRELSKNYERDALDVAVRSSATAEDLPTASFAGQQETYLNVSGEEALLDACRNCFASLYTDRAIVYRNEKGFNHLEVALSVGVQKMVRSDRAGAGVLFTLDMDSGFPDVVVINAAWGLGETVVQGTVSPDEYMVFKPLLENDGTPIIKKQRGEKEKKMIYRANEESETMEVETSVQERKQLVLNDEEILTLGRWAVDIEEHYERPMDVEWAKDGKTNELFIVQARPETVQSQKQSGEMTTFHLKETSKRLVSGLSIGESIASGPVKRVQSADEIDSVQEGDILVTEMTQPDWVPVMKKAGAIVTDEGGRTCHAAIVSRELSVPTVVGTGNATQVLNDEQDVTVSCAEGRTGYVYDGILEYDQSTVNVSDVPETNTDIMINMASPEGSFRWWRLPADGIGLARMEFIINNTIEIHPMALVRFDDLESELREQITERTIGYDDPAQFFVDQLAEGIAQIAAPQYPKPVIVRMSDLKSNEYASLIGGERFEPEEDNPMLGVRGASRYTRDLYREGFGLECRAINRVRKQMGFRNIIVMIPFCRTPDEAGQVREVMADYNLGTSSDESVYVMSEIPSNVLLADAFSRHFDGFSIGTNDLTQLVLGIDRDSTELSDLFDERNEAVKSMVQTMIEKAHENERPVGICGQAPSDYPEFAEFLVRNGIDSMSLSPAQFVSVKRRVGELEASREPDFS